MNSKKRLLIAGLSLALGGNLIYTNPTITKASMYTPENWVARTVEEVKSDLVENENTYLLVWGDTLSVLSEATGVPIETLVEINNIANRDFILAGHSIYLAGDFREELTWNSMQEAIDFYEANIIANNDADVAEVALGSEFYDRDSWELISNEADTIVLSINNVGVGGKDIIEFVKGIDNTVMTFYAADSPYPDRPTARQTVRNYDHYTLHREELNPVNPS